VAQTENVTLGIRELHFIHLETVWVWNL